MVKRKIIKVKVAHPKNIRYVYQPNYSDLNLCITIHLCGFPADYTGNGASWNKSVTIILSMLHINWLLKQIFAVSLNMVYWNFPQEYIALN